MYLINPDIDYIIASFIFKYERTGLIDLKNIYIAMGKSNYDGFINLCRIHFYKFMFNKYKVFSLYEMLQKVTGKKNIKFFPTYNVFNKRLNSDIINFENLKAKHRLILYHMSLYHGYLWICTKTDMWEVFGYKYARIHDRICSCKNKLVCTCNRYYPYYFLKRHRVHNLKYYDLVEKKNSLYESIFVRNNVSTYKKGVTKERKDISCIKILSIDKFT